MSDEAKVRELFAPMQAMPIDSEGARFKVDRETVVTTILNAPAAIHAARLARSRRFAVLGVAAGFAALLGAGSWALAHRASNGGSVVAGSLEGQLHISQVSGHVTRLEGASLITLAPGAAQAVSPAGELVTAAKSEASVTAVNGLELKLFENTRVALAELRTIHSYGAVHLDGGSIRCRVPHLAEGERFAVITPDATVVVHGTVFSVSVGGATGATQTCVRVEEGMVSVHAANGETRLLSSQSWGCAVPGDDAAASEADAPSPGTSDAPSPGTSWKPERASLPRLAGEPARRTPGTLDEENRLFQSGLAAERRGDPRAAAESFELLLSRNPRSPLAADARTALARVRPETP
ncbi:MAG TPA: FecR domain-containing protein [Polyangiaceae bacterium]|nr:FecR domain-containing protein [Polyangiaceae bacterium]